MYNAGLRFAAPELSSEQYLLLCHDNAPSFHILSNLYSLEATGHELLTVALNKISNQEFWLALGMLRVCINRRTFVIYRRY